MKILYGITKSNFGGAQRYVFDMAREAKKAGHDVAVMCGGEGALVEKLRAENIRVISIPGFGRDIDLWNDAPRLWFIIQTLRREKPDVFHINSSKMGGAGIFSGRLLGIPKIIFTAHGWAFNEPRPGWQKGLIKFFTWLTIFSAYKTICVSKNASKQISNWPLIAHKLTVIHNGADGFELFSRTSPTFTVGTLAELHRIKGIDILLQAWVKFRHSHDGKLVIYGTGEEEVRLKELTHTLAITDSVEFKGYVENAKSSLGTFDIFVLPSRSEALPYTVLEAGLAGKAVIASRVGGIPEIIESGVNGILIEPGNVEELFSTLVLLSENEDLRERLGASLRETILSEFSLQKMAHATLNVYA